jgi:acylphosphatase|tara:strand:- start:178 stop:486 length:309 start_codon:yes stop_codon:yes gene_type:complete
LEVDDSQERQQWAQVHVRVDGRVQGVGFRWFTRERALTLGLTGYVRNLPDGAVETVAEGPTAALDEFVSHVHHGPPMSRVLSCQASTPVPPTGEYDDFDIRH